MNKRALAKLFANRLKELVDSDKKGIVHFLNTTGMDRSALSQFLDPGCNRLPRAETLRSIAEAYGVSIDWLLGIENSPQGRQQIASSVQIESEVQSDGTTPLSQWHIEAADSKLRYVPSSLPDVMKLSTELVNESLIEGKQTANHENMLANIKLADMDLEIAMPIQTLVCLASQNGIWQGSSPELCKQQLLYMSKICEATYPTLRLHLYDESRIFSAPFMVFGKQRVALYIGNSYLVITSSNQVKAFARRFDALVRETIVTPDKVHKKLSKLATSIII